MSDIHAEAAEFARRKSQSEIQGVKRAAALIDADMPIVKLSSDEESAVLRAQLAEDEAARVAYVESDRLAKIERLRANWGAPKRQVIATGLDFGGPWGKTLEALAAKLGTGFTRALAGKRGPGKTQLAVELMRRATAELRTSMYSTAAHFFETLKAAYKKDSRESGADVLQRFSTPTLLVIDEAGRRGETDWENNMLFELLDTRYREMLDTLLISNQSTAEMTAALGPSILARINETGGLIQCDTWPVRRSA
jgi:DNA replication protein DnaC